MDPLQEKVRKLLARSRRAGPARDGEVSLDSLEMARLVVLLQQELRIVLAVEDVIQKDNFTSLANIADLVRRKSAKREDLPSSQDR